MNKYQEALDRQKSNVKKLRDKYEWKYRHFFVMPADDEVENNE